MQCDGGRPGEMRSVLRALGISVPPHQSFTVAATTDGQLFDLNLPCDPHVALLFPQVISQLRVLSRSVTAGSKFDRELWSSSLSPVLNLWKKLNQVSLRCLPGAASLRTVSLTSSFAALHP